ncbi:MAG: tetratricopeptide repeat protein [Planctomycetes bacterium]|nr:tetratricopeptide repeat protein [Planctomycetota bacterium]
MTTGGLATAESSGFDILTSPIPSFAALVAARPEIFRRRHSLESFRNRLGQLPDAGEEGRRKGLGYWMTGDYARCAELLAKHAEDNVASFTRAKACMSMGRPQDALPIYERLSKAYPDEPRPRGGMLEARLEMELAAGDEEKALTNLEAAFKQSSAAFNASAEGRYLHGRAAELVRDWEQALDHYTAARELDPTHRANLFRLAYVSERAGLDEEALNAYQTLASMLPIDKNVLINIGMLLEDLGRDDDAAACFDTALRSYPTDVKLRRFMDDARSGMNMYYDEDLERKQDRLDQILRIPITDFELSVRARNCLNKMNILTLGDLVRQTEQELLSYKNFGETSLAEIKEILGSKGLRLGMAREEAVASIEAARRRYNTDGNNEVMNKAISELELSIRARRTVEAMGCLTVGDVVQHSEDELLGMPNFGQTSLQELKAKLAELGLKLKPRGA